MNGGPVYACETPGVVVVSVTADPGAFPEIERQIVATHVEALGAARRESSRLLDTRAPRGFLNPPMHCQCCVHACYRGTRIDKGYLAEYFAQSGEPYFWGLCPRCFRRLPAAVRREYVRK